MTDGEFSNELMMMCAARRDYLSAVEKVRQEYRNRFGGELDDNSYFKKFDRSKTWWPSDWLYEMFRVMHDRGIK